MPKITNNQDIPIKLTRKQELLRLQLAIVKQMITLATSGFGLVAALAWNNVIRELVDNYIKPYLPSGSTLLSLFIYATVVTVLAVVVTLQLTKLADRLTKLGEIEKEEEKDNK